MAAYPSPRRLAFAAVIAAAGILAVANRATAQAGGRMRVLVPDFAVAGGMAPREGARLAQQLRRQINTMNTHAALSPDDNVVKDALRRFGRKAEQLDCVEWMQLAAVGQLAPLVLCGRIDSGHVTARFAPASGADPFEVPAFAWQSAEQAAQQVVQSFGTYVRQLSMAVNCNDYVHAQSWAQALEACTQVVELNPTNASAHYARGSALRELDQPEEALDAFRRVLALDPVHQDAMLAAGLLAARLGRQDVSQQYFQQYLEFDPANEAVRLKVASDLATAGNPAGALALMEQWTSRPEATRLAHQYAGSFALNAAMLKQQEAPSGAEAAPDVRNLFARAVTSFERAIALQPDSVDASVLRQLMHAHRGVGDIEKALEIGTRATRAGDDAQTWSVYAQLLQAAKRNDEALRALERAAELDPATPGLNARRGMLYLELGRLNDAVAALRVALDRNELPAGTVENISQQMTATGWTHSGGKRYDLALAHFRAARQLGKSERSIAMANFFHGATLFTQAEALLRTATTSAPAIQAKPLLTEAKALLEAAGGYTDEERNRVALLASIRQFTEMADALIRARR